MTRFSVASKVFLLGEYGVLSGLPALLAAIPPRFEMEVSSETDQHSFHAQSPISRLAEWTKSQGTGPLSFRFLDPHQGRGGFGASTAQFAMAWMALQPSILHSEKETAWLKAWRLYRNLMQDPGAVPPSGADLVVQWRGGVQLFESEKNKTTDCWNALDWSQLLVFSATHQEKRKVPTHEHLQSSTLSQLLRKEGTLYSRLSEILDSALSAMRSGDSSLFGDALNQYAEALCQAKLEIPATREDRQVLKNLPGVLGVKGTGALQADGIIVLVRDRSQNAKVIQTAMERNLALVCEGIPQEKGIQIL